MHVEPTNGFPLTADLISGCSCVNIVERQEVMMPTSSHSLAEDRRLAVKTRGVHRKGICRKLVSRATSDCSFLPFNQTLITHSVCSNLRIMINKYFYPAYAREVKRILQISRGLIAFEFDTRNFVPHQYFRSALGVGLIIF